MTEKLRAYRQSLNDREAMAEAQAGCVPCKLCGGKAVITDAGVGAGYYIACENSGAFRASQGCMITERRLGGWAYNVMDWWNRLHSTPTPAADEVEAEKYRARASTLEEVERELSDIYQRMHIEGREPRFADAVKSVRGMSRQFHGSGGNALRLAFEDADALLKIAEEADDNNWQDWAAVMRQASGHFRAAIAAMQARSAEPAGEEPMTITAEELGQIMQDEWGDICEDAQAHPEDIRREGRKLFYLPRHWTAAIADRLNARRPEPATPTNPERLVEQKAAEAIRKAFFTSVSGGSPQYHLSLAYQSIDEMHEAEDAIKAWAKSVLEPKA